MFRTLPAMSYKNFKTISNTLQRIKIKNNKLIRYMVDLIIEYFHSNCNLFNNHIWTPISANNINKLIL